MKIEAEVIVHGILTDLKSCSIRRDLQWGRKLHATAVESSNDVHIYVATALIKMYANCSCMVEAHCVFDSIKKPNVVSWTSLLTGYAEAGDGNVALHLFSKMKAHGCVPDIVSYVAALKACTVLALNEDVNGKGECLKWGREIHSEIGFPSNDFVQSALIDMYSNGGSMVEARGVFDSMQKPNVVCWTALLLGYAENGEGSVSLDLFSSMKASGCIPDSVTYVAILKACASLAVNGDRIGCLERGTEVHSEIGYHSNRYVHNTLMDMYAKCGSMVCAHRVFDSIPNPDVVSWNALLLGYAENGEGHVTLDLFSRMKAHGCAPNSVTFIATLKACASLAENGNAITKKHYLGRGKVMHSEIGCHLSEYVKSTLIDMYAKCGSMCDARLVFECIPKPNVVAWNALILGYAENGEGFVALNLLSKMKARGCIPDSVTYVAALKACASLGALRLGRKFHLEISDFSANLVTCLVDFYAKCGNMVEAREVFEFHRRTRDVTTWTALLAGYGSLGDSDSVFKLFEGMQDEGLRPDGVTFVCLLLCCSHAGLVETARKYFEAMPVQYGVTRRLVHYTCMVDVLGRANQLNEATAVIQKMPCNPDAVTWMTLLGACRKWKNVEIGKGAFEALVDMDTKNESAYVLMAHIYGSRGMWEEQGRVLETARRCLCQV